MLKVTARPKFYPTLNDRLIAIESGVKSNSGSIVLLAISLILLNGVVSNHRKDIDKNYEKVVNLKNKVNELSQEVYFLKKKLEEGDTEDSKIK